jgi:nucleotide-binding universal stress UspA family protein
MYKKILVPVDGSEPAEAVLPHVQAIASRMGAEIVLFRVPEYAYDTYDLATTPYLRIPAALPEERQQAIRKATEYLERMKLKLALQGAHVSTALKEGVVAAAITQFVHEADADLIAMSTHGRTGLSRLVFGSVADRALRQAAKPLLLIRPPP